MVKNCYSSSCSNQIKYIKLAQLSGYGQMAEGGVDLDRWRREEWIWVGGEGEEVDMGTWRS